MILLYSIFIWHLYHTIVLDCFKDYNFRIMDIFINYFYCYYTVWNEAFPLNFLVCLGAWGGGEVLLVDSFDRCLGEHPRRAARNVGWFAEDLHTGKLDGETCVLHCVYLFICLLFVYLLCVCVFAF